MILQSVLAALAVAMFLIVFGCSPKTLPPLQSKTDSTRVRVEIKYDSIWMDRWHVIKEKGDTIWIHDSIFIEKWREKHTRDTICLRDSIPYKVEVIKEVRKRNGYDRLTARGFWILLAAFAIIFGVRIFLRFKGIK